MNHRLDSRIEHRVHELCVRVRADGPADDQPVGAIDDGREVYLAGRDLELRDVSEPLLVRCSGLEVAIDEILRRRADLAQIGAVPTMAFLASGAVSRIQAINDPRLG